MNWGRKPHPQSRLTAKGKGIWPGALYLSPALLPGRYSGAMAEESPNPEAPESGRAFPRMRIAYVATAGWMLVVLAVTNADPGHPFFEYIFNVPLAIWIGVAVVYWIVRTWRAR